MKWEKVKLGDIIEIKKGEYITKKEAKEGPYPVILGGQEPAYYIDHFNHTGKAIVVSRSGASAGYVSFWNEPIFVTDGYMIEPKSKVTFEFLFYLMKHVQSYLQGLQGGAAIPHVNPRIITSIDVRIPSVEAQKCISGIISKYDNLIENNQKQIKLLEEAAQRLYKEWFVDLHFPGHENTPIVDGLPEGWKNGNIASIAFDNGKHVKKTDRDKYECYLPIDSLPKKSLAYLSVKQTELAESSLISFEGGDILFGAMRPYFHKVVVARHHGLTRTTCFVINSLKKAQWSYLLMVMFSEKAINFATTVSVGTTMPYVRWEDFIKMPIIIPSDDICEKFNKIISLLIVKVNKLAEKTELLQEARERLLPKLMNGEIEV